MDETVYQISSDVDKKTVAIAPKASKIIQDEARESHDCVTQGIVTYEILKMYNNYGETDAIDKLIDRTESEFSEYFDSQILEQLTKKELLKNNQARLYINDGLPSKEKPSKHIHLPEPMIDDIGWGLSSEIEEAIKYYLNTPWSDRMDRIDCMRDLIQFRKNDDHNLTHSVAKDIKEGKYSDMININLMESIDTKEDFKKYIDEDEDWDELHANLADLLDSINLDKSEAIDLYKDVKNSDTEWYVKEKVEDAEERYGLEFGYNNNSDNSNKHKKDKDYMRTYGYRYVIYYISKYLKINKKLESYDIEIFYNVYESIKWINEVKEETGRSKDKTDWIVILDNCHLIDSVRDNKYKLKPEYRFKSKDSFVQDCLNEM